MHKEQQSIYRNPDVSGLSLPPIDSAAELNSDSRFEQRVNRIEQRIAAVEMVYQSKANWEVTALKECLSKISTYLKDLRHISSTKFIERMNFIANPSREALEENGRFCRKLAQLSLYPTISHQLFEYIRETFWLNRQSYPVHSKTWDSNKQCNKAHDFLPVRFCNAKRILDDQYRQILVSEALLDAKVRRIIDQIPLPEEQRKPEIMAARKKNLILLEQQNILGFGDCIFTHRSPFKLQHTKVLSQREIDDLAFQGRLELIDDTINILSLPAHSNWSTLEQLRSILSTDTENSRRIFKAFERAGRNKGLHVLGQFHNNGIRDVVGLDNATFWFVELGKSKGGDSNYYGTNIVKSSSQELSNAFVSLGDDVMVNADNPYTILQYANGLISLEQFKQLVLDWTKQATNSQLEFQLPSFSWFLTNDFRIEIQTRS